MADVRAQPSTDRFVGDLGLTLRALAFAPLLPLATVVLWAATRVRGPNALSYLPLIPLWLIWCGWLGTERIWLLRLFRRETIPTHELWRFTWALASRFLALGALAGLVTLPLTIALTTLALMGHDMAWKQPAVMVSVGLMLAAIDVALTFVAPALTFSTRKLGTAWRIGTRMLAREWRAVAPYALVPAMTMTIFTVGPWAPNQVPLFWGLAVVALQGLLNLWFKGATTAFYLRRAEVDAYGSVYEEGPIPPVAVDRRVETAPA